MPPHTPVLKAKAGWAGVFLIDISKEMTPMKIKALPITLCLLHRKAVSGPRSADFLMALREHVLKTDR